MSNYLTILEKHLTKDVSFYYTYIVSVLWPRGQAVKTPPFHGGIMGSNPVGVTNSKETLHIPFYGLCGVFLFSDTILPKPPTNPKV